MSKKKSQAKVTCLGCGSRMKNKDVACRKCGQMRPAGMQGKGVAVQLVKSANVLPLIRKSARAKAAGTARPACWNGCPPGKPGHVHCVSCGARYGLSYAQHMDRTYKAADPLGSTYWGVLAQRETDPAQREAYRELARTEAIRAAGGEGAFVAKVLGYKSLADAARRETDPAQAQFFRQAEIDYYRNGGGQHDSRDRGGPAAGRH